MIYLKVRGGLCNRIRAIDSMIDISSQYNQELTILWPLDSALNAPFESLFKQLHNLNHSVTIINCPAGFPEKYFPKPIRTIKNIIKKRKLDKNLSDISKKIYKIKKDQKLTADYLDKQYNITIENNKNAPVDILDRIFIENLKLEIENTFNEPNKLSYIDTCYRHSNLKNNYKYFLPESNLAKKINKKVSNYNTTYGLHIRRSDHITAKKLSTIDKFTAIIDKKLLANPKSTFFLSTDDETTKKELLSIYGNKIMYNEVSSYDRNSPEAIKDAIVDLYCLSRTKLVYGSHHSSFSQVAAQIGNIEEITAK